MSPWLLPLALAVRLGVAFLGRKRVMFEQATIVIILVLALAYRRAFLGRQQV